MLSNLKKYYTLVKRNKNMFTENSSVNWFPFVLSNYDDEEFWGKKLKKRRTLARLSYAKLKGRKKRRKKKKT